MKMEVRMPVKKYRVRLTKEQREVLEDLTKRGVISVRKYKRARVLLLADEASEHGRKRDEEIVNLVQTSLPTVGRIRRRFVEEGLDAALNEKPRPGKPKTFSGKDRAAVIALACSEPPEGRARWSLRLLADKMVELELVDSISHKTVRDILKKTNFSLISKDSGALAS
jgi:transposase